MAKRQTVEHIIHNTLAGKIAFGESKHANKQDVGFGVSTYKIYSYNTYNTYLKEGKQFAKWLEAEKGINKVKDIKELEPYAKEYIQYRLDNGISVYTCKMERSALGMLFGKQVEIEMPRRDNGDIKRSRLDTKNDKYISRTGKYRDVFTIATATGGRRKDISKLEVSDFKEINGRLYVQFLKSKGGRDRLAPVLPSLETEVMEIIKRAKEENRSLIFPRIPKEVDVHGLRREYTKNIYNAFEADHNFRNEYLKNIGCSEKHEYYVYKDKDGNRQMKEVKATVYRDREGNVWDRMSLFATSQADGHSRLDVSVTHYLKS